MQALWLLGQNPDPTEAEIREGISGNLCRCTGYVNIVKAIEQAAAEMRAAAAAHRRAGSSRPRPAERERTRWPQPKRSRPPPKSAGWVTPSSARRIRASSAARASTSTTSTCPRSLWLDIVRSPYAHARIKSIDASEALKVPGVAAVVTGKDLEGYKLHWMPTLAGDMQMVLPVDTVMYQSQEVAAVIATSRYAAADGVAAVLVDYEPLPVIVDPHKALEPDAFVLRPDRGPDKANNHIWHWESGDRAATDTAMAGAEVRVSEDIYIPRIHVASIETCGCVADWDPVRQQLTLHMTSQAPHAIRTVLALVAAGAGLPISEQNIRVKTHDIGGGFGGKVPVYPGYVLAVAASFLIGKPVKWIEDRSENLQADSFARDYHIHAELGRDQGRQDHRPQGQDDRRPRLHGRGGGPVEVPGRPVQRDHRLVRLQGRLRRGRRGLHEQAAGRRRLPLLVPGDRGGPRHRADGRHPGPRHRQGPGPAPDGELHPARAVPVQDADRLGVRLGQLPGRAPARRWT